MAPSPSRSGPTRAQQLLQPADLILRHHVGYQRLRRASLALSFAAIALAPLWQLAVDARDGAGLAHPGRWTTLAQALPLPAPARLEGAPWTISVAGLEFLDPLAAASLAVTNGMSRAAWLGLLPVLLLMLLMGRFFCGWICPYVPLLAVSNAVRALVVRSGLKPVDLRLPRAVGVGVLIAILVASAVAGTPVAPHLYPPALIGREVARAILQGSFGVGALVLLAIFGFDTLISRGGFCRSICPGGALFSLLSWKSPVRVRRDPDRCTDCTACDVVCNLGQGPMTDRLDSGCERCGKCVAACPTDALHLTLLRSSPPAGKKP